MENKCRLLVGPHTTRPAGWQPAVLASECPAEVRLVVTYIMEKDNSLPQITPVERQAENEAHRLTELIEDASAAVALRTPADSDSIEAAADRIESASRDLVFAL